MTTALITPRSTHCRSVSFTTTNFIRWFDQDAPEVRLSFTDDQLDAVIVKNPYDRATYGAEGECVIRVGATEDKRSDEKP